ncbi:natriuretic peptides B [Diretmus argenteus]
MHLTSIPLCSVLLLFNLQLLSSYPIGDGLTDGYIDVLKVLLHRLEESIPEAEVDQSVPAARERLEDLDAMEEQPQTGLDEAAIREFLSAKNLKSVRNDSTKKTSGCFGRRMDRIGSMSSLGCNTVGRYSKSQGSRNSRQDQMKTR